MVKCLIVDDDLKLLHYVSTHLEANHIHTITHSNGESALKYLNEHQVDIAVVDIMMPGIDGFKLCKTLKDYYDIPVIMLTARDALSDKEHAFISGTDDYVTKPFEVKELLFRIQAILRRYQINAQSEIQIGNMLLNETYMEIQVNTRKMNLRFKRISITFSVV